MKWKFVLRNCHQHWFEMTEEPFTVINGRFIWYTVDELMLGMTIALGVMPNEVDI